MAVRPERWLALGAAFLIAASSAPGADNERIQWHRDYATAMQAARETGKPIFLEFRCAP